MRLPVVGVIRPTRGACCSTVSQPIHALCVRSHVSTRSSSPSHRCGCWHVGHRRQRVADLRASDAVRVRSSEAVVSSDGTYTGLRDTVSESVGRVLSSSDTNRGRRTIRCCRSSPSWVVREAVGNCVVCSIR